MDTPLEAKGCSGKAGGSGSSVPNGGVKFGIPDGKRCEDPAPRDGTSIVDVNRDLASTQELVSTRETDVAGAEVESDSGMLDDDEAVDNQEFRRRRLTFAAQRDASSNVSPPEIPSMSIFRALELGEEEKPDVRPFPSSILGIYSCHGAEPGWDDGEEDLAKINQDRACVVYPYIGSDTCALLCVYDGHGERGDMVSNYVMNEIPVRLAEHPKIHDNPSLALQETFEAVDRALADEAEGDEQVYSGTTAVVALYKDNTIWVANAGDSRAVLATKGDENTAATSDSGTELGSNTHLVAVALSEDHNPDKPGELERIESCGGFVSPPPEEGLSARVWLDREMTRIGLAMARSIGDHAVKEAGVIATPEITVREIVERDAFLVLASDGVWEFMENKEVVRIVQDRLEGRHHDDEKRRGEEDANVTEACADVISVAASRWRCYEGAYRDDISCIVLRLPCFNVLTAVVAEGEENSGESSKV